jgi:hypothetical protein
LRLHHHNQNREEKMVLKKSRFTYANVASTLALVIAIGGGGAATAAAVTLANNSVGSAQIINGSVRAVDLHANSVPSGKIVNGAVGSAKIANGAVGDAKITNGTLTHNKFTSNAVGLVQGYAWSPVANPAPSSTLNNVYTYNSAGGAITEAHSSTGVYTVTFAGLNWNPGTVLVNAYGSSNADTCHVGGWNSPSVSVYCYTPAGVADNSQFTIAVIK